MNIIKARDAGGVFADSWGWEDSDFQKMLKGASESRLLVMLLAAVHSEMKRIRELMECHNLARGLQSMTALERLAREYWVKPRKRAKVKAR